MLWVYQLWDGGRPVLQKQTFLTISTFNVFCKYELIVNLMTHKVRTTFFQDQGRSRLKQSC